MGDSMPQPGTDGQPAGWPADSAFSKAASGDGIRSAARVEVGRGVCW